jgi:hypothetical protein
MTIQDEIKKIYNDKINNLYYRVHNSLDYENAKNKILDTAKNSRIKTTHLFSGPNYCSKNDAVYICNELKNNPELQKLLNDNIDIECGYAMGVVYVEAQWTDLTKKGEYKCKYY